jgi:hypothetical protein
MITDFAIFPKTNLGVTTTALPNFLTKKWTEARPIQEDDSEQEKAEIRFAICFAM